MAENELLTLYEQAIDKGREREKSFAAAKPQSQTAKKGGNSNETRASSNPKRGRDNPTESRPKKRQVPPQGMSIYKWVEKFLNGVQRTDGKCTFCQWGDHDCTKCWYLNPDQRPPGWEPSQGLWAYTGPQLYAKSHRKPEHVELPAQSKMTRQTDVDESEAFDMARPLGMMAVTHEGYPSSTGGADTDNTIDPSQYPSFKPWLSDTASSYFICSERSAMIEYYEYGPQEKPPCYETSTGETGRSEAHGRCSIQLQRDDGSTYDIQVKCEFNSKISCNIFASHYSMQLLGLWVNTKDHTVRKMDNDSIVGYIYTRGRLGYLKTVEYTSLSYATVAEKALYEHRRLAHCGIPKLKATSKIKNLDFHCHACHIAKAKRLVSHTPQQRSKDLHGLIHADVQPIKPMGLGGYNYYTIIVNDKHRVPTVLPHKDKGEASHKLITHCKQYKVQTGAYPKCVRIDGGLELKIFATWARKRGIFVEPTPPRSPEPNGVSERWAAYINQTARAMIIDSGLPAFLWPYAIDTAVYVIVRLINPGETKSPLQGYREDLGYAPDEATTSTDHLQPFGSIAYKQIPKEDRVQAEKMGPRAQVGHLVGYEGDHGHIYLVYIPSSTGMGKVIRSRDVTFNKYDDDSGNIVPSAPIPPPAPKHPGFGQSLRIDTTVNDAEKQSPLVIEDTQYMTGRAQTLSTTPERATPIRQLQAAPQTIPNFQPPDLVESVERFVSPFVAPSVAPTDNTVVSLASRSSARVNKGVKPRWLGEDQAEESSRQGRRREQGKGEKPRESADKVMLTVNIHGSYMTCAVDERLRSFDIRLPNTYKEAIASPQSQQWKAAMDDQISKLGLKKTWELVDKPNDPSVRPLPGKWVYTIKSDSENYITEFRARWVVCGNRQRLGTDFDDTYSPVVTETATKLVLSAIAIKGLYAEQVDFITAYLNVQLSDRKLYMRPPTGYEQGTKVCLLLQALYGLRQSPMLWNKTLDSKLREIGFRPLIEDPCVYIKPCGSAYIIIYVDDAIIAGPTKEEVAEVKRQLNDAYPLKELGEPGKFLGCHIVRDYDGRTITILQTPYVEAMLDEYGMSSCYKQMVPMNLKYLKDKDGDPVDVQQYLHLTGQFNWLATKTRPDIAYALGRLQRKNSSPTTTDMTAGKYLLRYLKGTKNHGICLGARPHEGLAVYVDSSYADNVDGKSTESFVTTFAGAPISWASKKQSFVASSSTIAEFCALTAAVKEAIWLRKLTVALDLEKPGPVTVYCDSSNALDIVKKTGYSSSTKWVDNRYFFVRDAYTRGDIEFRWIDSHSNPADGLTKPLERVKFLQFKELINLSDCIVDQAGKDRMDELDITDGFSDEGVFQDIQPGCIQST
jgi:Reverse transcriptase (RNA-dependent DNA polymerase)